MKMSLEEATMKALLGQLDTPEKEKDDVEGIIDGVLVVTDPEITPDEYEEVIDNAKEILEDTPEGEVPFNDQYVGEYLLTCPICGSSFINKDVLNVGDSCPICTEVPEQGFILNGQVATQEDVELQNDIKSEEEKEDNDDVNISLDNEEDIADEPVSEEDVEEVQDELLASETVRESDKKLEEVKELDGKYIKKMLINKLNESKQLTESTNKYEDLKNKHQEEFNKFPIKFAFSNEQFKKGMEELGLTENDTDKVVSIGNGGFMRKSDVDTFKEMNKRHRAEEKEAIDSDTTGEGYIKDMFEYELANHEYGYTYDLDDTLDALDLTIDEINKDERLKHGLDLALKRYKDSGELDESKNIIKRPEQLKESKNEYLKYTFEVYIDGLQPVMYTDDWPVNDAKKEYIENEGKGHDISEVKVTYFDEPLETDIKVDESKKIKMEGTNKYIPAEEKLEAIYDDYKRQGMLDAYWTDLLNLIDDFDALDRWFNASYPEDEDEDEDWDNLEED